MNKSPSNLLNTSDRRFSQRQKSEVISGCFLESSAREVMNQFIHSLSRQIVTFSAFAPVLGAGPLLHGAAVVPAFCWATRNHLERDLTTAAKTTCVLITWCWDWKQCFKYWLLINIEILICEAATVYEDQIWSSQPEVNKNGPNKSDYFFVSQKIGMRKFRRNKIRACVTSCWPPTIRQNFYYCLLAK